MSGSSRWFTRCLPVAAILGNSGAGQRRWSAQGSASPPIDDTKVALDTIWVLVTAFLVFFMNLGFATVESGLCRAKNTVNILAKNYIVFCCVVGGVPARGIRHHVRRRQRLHGHVGPLVRQRSRITARSLAPRITASTARSTGRACRSGRSSFFQLVFAGTAGTIVSGAVAERIKFGAFFLFSFLMIALILPYCRSLDLGRGLAGAARHARLCGLDGRPLNRRLGGIHRAAYPRSVRAWENTRTGSYPYPRPQHGPCRTGRLRALVRLVRLQSGLDDGGRLGVDRAHRRDDEHRGGHGVDQRARHDVDDRGQT